MNWLKEFIDYKQVTVFNFEKKLGIRSTIQKAIRDNSNLGSNLLSKIIVEFPEINPAWLLTGRGEMLQGVAEKKEVPSDKLADKIEIIKLQRSEIARLEKDLQQCLDEKKFIADRQPNV